MATLDMLCLPGQAELKGNLKRHLVHPWILRDITCITLTAKTVHPRRWRKRAELSCPRASPGTGTEEWEPRSSPKKAVEQPQAAATPSSLTALVPSLLSLQQKPWKSICKMGSFWVTWPGERETREEKKPHEEVNKKFREKSWQGSDQRKETAANTKLLLPFNLLSWQLLTVKTEINSHQIKSPCLINCFEISEG